jgi:acetylornithine deacetylase/succinyl-diaminopimelate desuccinylase-like protein
MRWGAGRTRSPLTVLPGAINVIPQDVELTIDVRSGDTIAESNAKQPDENLLLWDLRRATHVVACALHDLPAN